MMIICGIAEYQRLTLASGATALGSVERCRASYTKLTRHRRNSFGIRRDSEGATIAHSQGLFDFLRERLVMTTPANQQVTQLLVDWSNGNPAALDQLIPLVHEELHRLAHHYMSRERSDHTLQTSAIVNEAYLRLVDQKDLHWQNRAQFFGLAAQLMRHILVDHPRSHTRAKRGGGQKVALGEFAVLNPERGAELIALDEALKRLAAIHPRKGQIVELKFFGGLTVEEIAEFLKVSPVTVMRDWSFAKSWLHREISHDA